MNTRYFAFGVAAAILFAALALYSQGCARQVSPPARVEAKPFVIGDDASAVARLTEPVEATADVYRAGSKRPVSGRVHVESGSWVVPQTVFAAPPLAGGACGQREAP